MLSCVLLLPDNQVDTGNAVSEAMGWGSPAYTVPLSADGSEPASHWGLHTWAGDDLQAMIETGFYPPQVEDAGITQDAYNAMLAVLIYSFWQDYVDHFATVCAENGLTVVAPGDA
ncbi:MAG: hypothetical protein RLZZ387_2633 [Chloroflexota bacterium]|jgi:hypothetical protein